MHEQHLIHGDFGSTRASFYVFVANSAGKRHEHRQPDGQCHSLLRPFEQRPSRRYDGICARRKRSQCWPVHSPFTYQWARTHANCRAPSKRRGSPRHHPHSGQCDQFALGWLLGWNIRVMAGGFPEWGMGGSVLTLNWGGFGGSDCARGWILYVEACSGTSNLSACRRDRARPQTLTGTAAPGALPQAPHLALEMS